MYNQKVQDQKAEGGEMFIAFLIIALVILGVVGWLIYGFWVWVQVIVQKLD